MLMYDPIYIFVPSWPIIQMLITIHLITVFMTEHVIKVTVAKHTYIQTHDSRAATVNESDDWLPTISC